MLKGVFVCSVFLLSVAFSLDPTATSCPTGQYLDGSTCNTCRTCPPFQYQTAACSGTRDTQCAMCTTDCPEGQYIASKCTSQHDLLCQSCSDACEDCLDTKRCVYCERGYGLLNGGCVKCNPSGEYYIGGNKPCQKCADGCMSCTDKNYCNQCESGLTWDTAQLKCTKCPSGFWFDRAKLKCEMCVTNCIVCRNEYQCQTCWIGFELTKDYTCKRSSSASDGGDGDEETTESSGMSFGGPSAGTAMGFVFVVVAVAGIAGGYSLYKKRQEVQNPNDNDHQDDGDGDASVEGETPSDASGITPAPTRPPPVAAAAIAQPSRHHMPPKGAPKPIEPGVRQPSSLHTPVLEQPGTTVTPVSQKRKRKPHHVPKLPINASPASDEEIERMERELAGASSTLNNNNKPKPDVSDKLKMLNVNEER